MVELIRKEAKKGEPNPKTNKAFFSTQAFEFMEKFKAKWPKVGDVLVDVVTGPAC